MMKGRTRKSEKSDRQSNQHKAFIEAARDLGCDDNESHFEEKLKAIARQKPRERTPATEKATGQSEASKERK